MHSLLYAYASGNPMRVWRIHDPAALGAETVFWTRSRNSPPDSDEYIVAVPKVRSSKYAIVGIYVPCATSRKVPGGGFRVRARRVRKCAVPWTLTLRRVLSRIQAGSHPCSAAQTSLIRRHVFIAK